MGCRCRTPLPLLLLLLVGWTAAAAAGDAGAATLFDQVDYVDYRAEIEFEVGRMGEILDNMTTVLESEKLPDDPADEQNTVTDERESLPPGPALPEHVELHLPTLAKMTLEGDEYSAGDPTKACDADDVNTALSESADTLDQVEPHNLTPTVLNNLTAQNEKLETFLTTCSLSNIEPEDKVAILSNIVSVQTHVAAASIAAKLPENGLEVGSAFMVTLITLSCLLALVALVGLAMLAHRHVMGGSSGGRPARTGASPRVTGQQNPAYQPTDPPGSLHQAHNANWRRHSDIELDSPLRQPVPKKSTLGRIWGGVVRDYERSRDSVAEPRPERYPEGRYPSPSRYQSEEPRQERRASPAPRRASPPPRRASPPPRRATPPMPRSDRGGDNWAYGPTGRNKSTDSPFASAW